MIPFPPPSYTSGIWVGILGNVLTFAQSTSQESLAVVQTYGSLSKANRYFDNRLRAEIWQDSSSEDKMKALNESTSIIDSLNYVGCKSSNDQKFQFPRSGGTAVPLDVEVACYEIALKLLEGMDPELEVSNLAAEVRIFAGVRTAYNRTFALDHIRAGVVSQKAWTLLLPYLNNGRTINLCRVD